MSDPDKPEQEPHESFAEKRQDSYPTDLTHERRVEPQIGPRRRREEDQAPAAATPLPEAADIAELRARCPKLTKIAWGDVNPDQARCLAVVRFSMETMHVPVPKFGEESSANLSLIASKDEWRDPYFMTKEEQDEAERNLVLVVGGGQRDYEAIRDRYLQENERLQYELMTRTIQEADASVNVTNVDHILKWLNDVGTRQEQEEFCRLVGIGSVAELASALTLTDYGPFVNSLWKVRKAPTTTFDLGLSIDTYGYGAGWRAARLGKAGQTPEKGFDQFEDQVEAFNTNKWFKHLKKVLHPDLFRLIQDLNPERRKELKDLTEQYLLDMGNYDHVDTEEDLPANLYIQGIVASVLKGYGLRRGLVEPMILQQPIQSLIRYLEERRQDGVEGIPKLGEPVLHENGTFTIGGVVYGHAVYHTHPQWHMQPDWIKPRIEERQRFIRAKQCLIQLTKSLYLGDPTRPFPVVALADGEIVAFHRLPVTRFRVRSPRVNPAVHGPVALGHQVALIFQEARRYGWNTLPNLKENFQNAQQHLHEEMKSEGKRWHEQQDQEIRRLHQEIERLRLKAEREELSTEESVQLLERIVALSGTVHEETAEHITRVETTTLDIATNERLQARYPQLATEAYRTIIRYGARLHDIGKIVVPDAVVSFCGKFETVRQVFLMKTHAGWGGDILKTHPNPIIRQSYLIARQHHEKWQGGGYPDGLKGDDIEIGAQIVAVADVWDALAVKRKYQDREKTRSEVMKIFANDTEKGDFNPLIVLALFTKLNDELPCTEEEHGYLTRVQAVADRAFPEVD